MIKLTKEQKADLKELQKKPWFKVLISIIESMELDVFRIFKNIDYKNPKDLEILAKNTHYVKGMEHILYTLNTWTNQVSERKSDEEIAKEEEEKKKKELKKRLKEKAKGKKSKKKKKK